MSFYLKCCTNALIYMLVTVQLFNIEEIMQSVVEVWQSIVKHWRLLTDSVNSSVSSSVMEEYPSGSGMLTSTCRISVTHWSVRPMDNVGNSPTTFKLTNTKPHHPHVTHSMVCVADRDAIWRQIHVGSMNHVLDPGAQLASPNEYDEMILWWWQCGLSSVATITVATCY